MTKTQKNEKKNETTQTKKEYQKANKKLLIIDYKTYNKKDNTQTKKDLNKCIENITKTIKLNDNGLNYSVRVSNELLQDFKKVLHKLSTTKMSIMLNKIDDFQLKVCICNGYISNLSIDDVKNGNDFNITWKIKNYKLVFDILRLVYDETKNNVIK